MSLTQQTAKRRARLIRPQSIQYNFHIILEDDRYHGLAQITFYLQTINFQNSLELDFSGLIIEGVIINNLSIQWENSKNFIFLPKQCLQKGKNRVSVLYQNQYDNDLNGLVQFQQAGELFVYTGFQPYFANRVFPCFDQPDLKAKMKLTVLTSPQKIVLSNESPDPPAKYNRTKFLLKSQNLQQQFKLLHHKFSLKVKQNAKITTFPQTQLLPAYIFCFAAGNYKQIPTNKGTVPMSLFTTPSALANVSKYSNFIFETTIKCMSLFQEKFNVKFPFKKYDQLFIKQCSSLAMQNAAIVTFNEPRLLPLEQATIYEYYYICVVVSHELSHHWFGNYVTMVWWDDLWLNESFAQWMSCYSIQQLIKRKQTFDGISFESSYVYFRHGKVYGYQQDERINSTHPIRGQVKDTDASLSIFDGITYEKGASCLKQLTYLVGQDTFFQAVSKYFSRFSWGNATIRELLSAIKQVVKDTPVDLDEWRTTWLETASLNVFTSNWDRDKKTIIINQTSFDDSNILRTHKIMISLFKQDGTFDVLEQVIIGSTPRTIFDYSLQLGQYQYKAILLNHEDHTFVENIIDPISLDFFKKNINKIPDILTRLMVWYNIRSMANLSYITILDYVNLVQDKLFEQQNNFLLQAILKNTLQYLKDFIYSDQSQQLRSKLFQRLYNQLKIVDIKFKQRVQILSNSYISYAKTQAEIMKLKQWLNNDDPLIINISSNLDQKWKIVKKIFALNNFDLEQKWKIFQYVEYQDNNPSRVQDVKTVCNVLIATQTEFEEIYNSFKTSKLSVTQKRLKAQGWINQCHYDWIVPKYQQLYYKDVVALSDNLSYEEFQFFYQYLKPIDDDLSNQVIKFNNMIDELSKKGNMDQHCRNLRKYVDDLEKRRKNLQYNSDINTALTQQRAKNRYDYIERESISYNSHLTFVQSSLYYTGIIQITFTLTQIPTFLPLDSITETIYNMYVNDKEVYPNINGQFIFIYKDNLKLGENLITIYYRNLYNNDGLGCMFYQQTVYQPTKQYVYTTFEPYGAHRFFPCFDQPDLKAKANFNVIIPTKWMAASNQKISFKGVFTQANYRRQTTTKDSKLLQTYLYNKSGNLYVFYQTKIISTYLFCVAAGQYYQIVVPKQKLHKSIQMSLLCIQSYSKSLDFMADFIVQMTTLSLDLFQKTFDTPYPFSKYDTIFCHQYKMGAMQNPGLITFNDTYLYPDKVSIQKMLGFASTIIHENSHNWFGNLVTMKWWDDLWLNQSFADFIAHWGLEQLKDKVTFIPHYDSGWKIFLVRGVSGYRQDQITETTHAVRSYVANTSVASTYFDRITYQKGSACLKQFVFVMGQDNFFKGIQDYFKQFAWKNGTIDDFLGKMEKYFETKTFTLEDWKKSWLLAPSLNVVSVQWDPSDISEKAYIKIKQRAYSNVYPTLRYHSTRIALFYQDATYDDFDVLLTPTSETIFEYDGSKNYRAVLVNLDYWDYFKYTIDPVSLKFFQENINNIDNVLTRMTIWHDLNEQVRDANYKISYFIQLLMSRIFTQTDDKIFQFQFSFLRDAVNNYISIPQRQPFKKIIYEAIYSALKNSPPPTNDPENRVKLLKDQLTVFANPNIPEQIDQLQNWRNGSNQDLKLFPITSTQGWEVIKLIYCVGDPSQYNEQQKLQKYIDQSSYYPGIKAQLTKNTCNMLIANLNTMKDTYKTFKQMNISVDLKTSYSQGWNNLVHLNQLKDTFKSQYFTDLPLLSKTLVSNHFEFFYQNLKPIDDNLSQTIDNYNKIKLQGGQMIGHVKVLTQIKYMYQLRLKLYTYNSLL